LKEEEKRWRPNDESTSPKGLSFHSASHTCLGANEDYREHEIKYINENDIQQLGARLNKKDKMILIKLLKIAREQGETIQGYRRPSSKKSKA
jgi:hypothetical protein